MIIDYLQHLASPYYHYSLRSPSTHPTPPSNDNINNNNNNNNSNHNSRPVIISSSSSSTSTTTTNDLLLSVSLRSNQHPPYPHPILSINTNIPYYHKSFPSRLFSSTSPSSAPCLPNAGHSSHSLLSRSRSSSSQASSRSSSSSISYKPLSPRATQDLISRLDATSSLLPQNLANFITAASLAARVSLRSSAFCIELVIESLRYSTTTSLGITRRALISAVGSARAVHYKTSNFNQQNSHSRSSRPSSCTNRTNDTGYLHVLDHYTNVGIYLVHHVFTMAELLSLAGLDLAHSVISTGFETAQLSVMLLDSIFGSNESSRALSAIIMLVRRELLHDPYFTPSHSSTLTGLTALTKATIAFACLQLATSRRTTSTMKMRVVWDATIITQSEVESKSLSNGIDYQLGINQGRAHGYHSSETPSIVHLHPELKSTSPASAHHSPRRSNSRLSKSSDQALFMAEPQSAISNHHSIITKRTRMDSFNSSIISTPPHSLSEAHCVQDREHIEFELNQFLTEGENQTEPDECESTLNFQAGSNGDQLVPEDLRKALYQVSHPSHSKDSFYHDLETTDTPIITGSCSSTFQLTALTTTTTTTTKSTITTTTAHSNNSTEKFTRDQFQHSLADDDDSHSSTPKAYLEDLPQWPAVLQPILAAYHLESSPTQARTVSSSFDSTRKRTLSAYRSWDPELNDRSKSMPSSPQRSRSSFPSMQTVVTRSLTRSKTHSDLTSMYLNSYSLVCPVPNFFSSETPLSSPSITSDVSSQQSEDPAIEHEIDPGSTTLEMYEDDDEGQLDDFGTQDYHSRSSSVVSPAIPRRPIFTSPQISSTSAQTIRTFQASKAVSPVSQPPVSDFPPQSLIKNLGRFMRYSSAAYGQQFMRIMGIGVDSFNYPNTKKHSANDHAFASHVRLPVDQIILSSFAEPNPILGNETLSPLVHYVTIDHDVKAVVLTCRGTLGLSDVLVDLTCEYEPISVDGGDQTASYLAHSGMLHSALRLRQESSTVHEVIKQALIDHPNYGLIITGHSLGGGVAALLAVLCSTRSEIFLEQNHCNCIQIDHPPVTTRFVTSFRSGFPPGRPIHGYTYGTPAVASVDLSEYTKGLVTTVCNGIDLVPTLSLGFLHDLKSVAVSLHEEENIAMDIVTKVVGLYRPNQPQPQHAPQEKAWRNHRQATDTDPNQAARELLEHAQDENSKENVRLKNHEIQNGVGDNRANSDNYLDPALDGSLFGKAETYPELGDWLWSLRRTMKAVSDAEKLYPPGDVWHVESYEVFVIKEEDEHLPETNEKNKSKGNLYSNGSHTSGRREGRRIILRACDDVPARFSEPIFGKTMFHDHIPSQYELVLELLEAAVTPPQPK